MSDEKKNSVKSFLISQDKLSVEHLRGAGTCLVSFNYAKDGSFLNELKAEGVTCQELTYDDHNDKWLSTYTRIASHCDTLLFVGDSFTSSAIRRERQQIVKLFRNKPIVMTNGWRDGEKDIHTVEFKVLSWDKFYLNFIGQGAITAAYYFRNHPRLKAPAQAAGALADRAGEIKVPKCQCMLM
uniref:Uncharacterized protein n=1 Tax=Aplanochytrium stocchinoi TaxID=215587 RepID=A0A7S3V3A3_9STRA|mmetsp:Transcript_8221/g.10398  ORF Transcript_8221/g.10398 Transcript_8221/m.10398 type:complete len:183 (+) Transcript_8221:112-660(+)